MGVISTYSQQLPNYVVAEDSLLRKAVGCVPIFGLISTIWNEKSLAEKINQTKNVSQLVRLIDIKNQYKAAAIIGDVIAIALIAIGILFCGSFSIIGSALAPLFVIEGLHYAYRIYHNRKIIAELHKNGIGPHVVV